jgi:serine/threonine protein kinase/Flp pilus assembly protein TadD
MSTDRTQVKLYGDEGELSVVLAEYLAALDRGEQPDREELLDRFPRLAERLRAFFAQQDGFSRLAAPLRRAATEDTVPPAFELIDEIGRGGMGLVLRGRDRVLDRELAIKVLLDCFRDRPEFVRRFIEEARITGRLQHPFIVPVHELGALPDGRPYFAMKLIEGRTLADLLAERPEPGRDLPRFLKVYEQVCQTLAYAHSRGVIHRDLKPANVMVGAFGEVQVMDWGLAKVLNEPARPGPEAGAVTETSSADQTQHGAVLGTFAFMPPEQASGNAGRSDRRSDVFGLGAILCEILTGLPPYTGEPDEVREKARGGRTQEARARLGDCGADAELIDLARLCLAANPASRPADGGAVADAMASYFAAVQERLRAAEIARAQAETVAVEERKRVALAEAKAAVEEKRARAERRRRRATLLMAASLLLLVIGASAFGLWYQRQQAERTAEIATRRAATERDVTGALGEVSLLRQEGLKQAGDPGRWQLTLKMARSAIQRAEDALRRGEPTESLVHKLESAQTALRQDERDCELFLVLERLRLEATGYSADDVRLPNHPALIAAAFKEYGLDFSALGVDEAAAVLRRHRHRDKLVDEIEVWSQAQARYSWTKERRLQQVHKGFRGVIVATSDWSRAERLMQVLDAVEPGPQSFRRRWHAARSANDARALVALAHSPQAQALSTLGVIALADDLIGVKAFDEARVFLNKGREREPNIFWLSMHLGLMTLAANLKSADEAIQHFHEALAARGHNAQVHIMICHALQAKGDEEGALKAAGKAVELDPAGAPAHHTLGSLQMELGDLDGAYQSFRKAAELDSVNFYPLDALGQVCLEQKKYDEAVRHFRRAIERNPKVAGIYVNLGNALGRKGNVEGALASYRKAIELFPEYGLAHQNLGHALLAQRDLDGAERCYRAAIQGDPNLVTAYQALAALLAARGDVTSALRVFLIPVERDPKSVKAQLLSSQMLLIVGDAAGALRCAQAAVELDPRSADTHLALIRALLKKGEVNEALRRGEEALALFPNVREVHDIVGTAWYWYCDFEKAVRSHRRALALNPASGVTYENIGLALRARGDFAGAADAFRTAGRLTKKGGQGLQLLAETQLWTRQMADATAAAREAVRRNPGDLAASFTLASVLGENGDFAASKAELLRAQATLLPLDSRREGFRQILEQCDHITRIHQRLPAVLEGKDVPTNAYDKLSLAIACARLRKRTHAAAAARLFAGAFAAEPIYADDKQLTPRVMAAFCAALAGTGGSDDSAGLDAETLTDLRRQARDWLRADLTSLKIEQTRRDPISRARVQVRLRAWQSSPDLAGVRDPQALLVLPTEERQAWLAFWDDVDRLQKRP